MNVLLIGLRGAGKSTIGRALAEATGRLFIDLDDETRAALGVATVREAWERLGERAFRDAEAAALAEALLHEDAVVALGGGTPTAPGCAERIQRLRRAGKARVVYLRLAPDELRRRLRAAGGAGEDRPSLTGADPLTEIDDVFARRDPLYTALADHVVVDAGSVDEAVKTIRAL